MVVKRIGKNKGHVGRKVTILDSVEASPLTNESTAYLCQFGDGKTIALYEEELGARH